MPDSPMTFEEWLNSPEMVAQIDPQPFTAVGVLTLMKSAFNARQPEIDALTIEREKVLAECRKRFTERADGASPLLWDEISEVLDELEALGKDTSHA